MQATDQMPAPAHSGDASDSAVAPIVRGLFIIPTRRGDGFTASIHGHTLALADPADHRFAPSPDDLLVASVASDLAWAARRFLRAYGLPDEVSISATWRTSEDLPGVADVNVTVTVSRRAEAASGALAAAFADSLAARSIPDAVVHLSLEE